MLGIKIDMGELNEDIKFKDGETEEWYGELPPPIRKLIDKQISRLSADELFVGCWVILYVYL